MIPCYTCLVQQTPVGPAGHQNTSVRRHQIAHRLYTIINTATHKHPRIHARSKQDL